MRSTLCILIGCCVTQAVHAQARCNPTDVVGVRIDYVANLPSLAVAMAPWSEVERNFPGVRGVTERTVFVTRERKVEIQRGQGLKVEVSRNVEVPAPGVHFRDQDGVEIRFVGYTQTPLVTMQIETANERIEYNSILGKAKRKQIHTRDPEMGRALSELEQSNAQSLGEREYAGLKCTAKRVPMQGAQSEVCVRNFHGWPVALYLQYELSEAGGMQWYRANNVNQAACISPSDMALPTGVNVEERRRAK